MKSFVQRLCWMAIMGFASSVGAAVPTHFGIEMADAGDLNGDGKHDLLSVVKLSTSSDDVGLYAIDGETGAKLWFASGFTSTYALYEFTPVTSIQSIDGDGIPDIALGVGGDEKVFFLSGSDGTLIDTLEVPEGYFGTSLLPLTRDLDGDGIRDLLVGAPNFNGALCPDSGAYTGKVFAISTGTRKIIWEASAPAGGSNFGWALAALNYDYDKDFKADVLVSDNCRTNSSSTRGAVYVLSTATGQFLQTVTNPTAQADWANIMFGYSLAATFDLDGDHVSDYFVGAPNISGQPGILSVDLFSGATGERICHYVSPTGDPLDGFGAWLAGGNFKLGTPANVCYEFGDSPHDLLVGSPDFPGASGAGKAYVLRIEKGMCDAAPLLTLNNTVNNSWFSNRVALIQPAWASPCLERGGYTDLLINSDDNPNTGGGSNDGLGSIRRYSGNDGSLNKVYVIP